MFLKAGALALALLLASRVLGLVRESAQAAAFGASGLADVGVLMLTLPDWAASLLAGGALAYVLIPAWAALPPPQVQQLQRRVLSWLLIAGLAIAILATVLRAPVTAWLAPGLDAQGLSAGASGLAWSAWAVPAALAAALWTTRLQHERDVAGMYGANLVVNGVLVVTLWAAAQAASWTGAVWCLGLGLLAAMGLRLAWLAWRLRAHSVAADPGTATSAFPAAQLWLWAALSAGLPLVLPFVARSAASRSGAGALATFNYAWKLVELPLVLAIQLVAVLAFPAVARLFATGSKQTGDVQPLQSAFALAWTLACAAAAGLLVGAPALAQLLFGWGRMQPEALALVAQWAAAGAWGLLPQALIAVSLTVLAAQSRLRVAVVAHAVGLGLLAAAVAAGVTDGLALMRLLNVLYLGVAILCMGALGRDLLRAVPWRALAGALALLVVVAVGARAGQGGLHALGTAVLLAAAMCAGLLVLLPAWAASPVLRQALRR